MFYSALHQHKVEKGKYIERCIRKITGLRALCLDSGIANL